MSNNDAERTEECSSPECGAEIITTPGMDSFVEVDEYGTTEHHRRVFCDWRCVQQFVDDVAGRQLVTDGGQADAGADRTLVITPSEFGSGVHYHKPREGEGGLPRCQGMFPQGTSLRPKENAELDGLEPCGHPACFGGEDGGE